MLEIIKMKLQGRDLIGFALTDCFFSAKNEEELINGELLLQLCSKVYMLEIYSCQFRQNEALVKEFLVSILQTTASLTELTISSDGLFKAEFQRKLYQAIHANKRNLVKLTKLYLSDLYDLRSE